MAPALAVYTTNALAPAVIDELAIDEETGEIDVIVKQDQLSLAIGSKGQNVRLASRLVGYKINISVDEEEAPSIEEQLTRELERGKEERELLYTGITSGLHAAGTPAAEAAARRNEDVAATESEDPLGEEIETEAVSADPTIEDPKAAAVVTEPTEPDTSAQTADPSETTEEKPS